ncbi:MAG: hypothetical protein H6810_00310 [Phycisphaeraceae bacterium]|nr:MAG: hypothetical protein H6810_00310 [Phycisphaeraceae bacterium]
MSTEIERLRRENRILRTAAVFVGGALFALAGMGMVQAASTPSRPDAIGVTTDGTYVYVLFRGGSINRMNIEERERVNLQNPAFYHSNEPFKWNRFVESW